MTATPTDIIRDFYDKLAAGDAPGALGLMASDMAMTMNFGPSVLMNSGPPSGR